MVCIVGVDLFRNKCGVISLIYIYGIGLVRVREVLVQVGIDESVKVQDWIDDNIKSIFVYIINQLMVEGELCFEVQMNIKCLMDIGCY